MKIAGIDIGGTHICCGIFDSENFNDCSAPKLLDYWEISSEKISSVAAFINLLADKINSVSKIGISVAGSVDSDVGKIIFSPNIPWLNNISLKKEIEQTLKIRVEIENDANCFILGEHKFGAGKDFSRIIGYTLGTGIGGGVVIDNKLLRGLGVAELGHIIIEKDGLLCNCGKQGCLEAYCGGIWAKRFAEYILPEYFLHLNFEKHLEESEISKVQDKLCEFLGDAKITSQKMFELAVSNDDFALYFWQRWGEYFGSGIAQVINILRPQAVILGGKIVKASAFFKPAVFEKLKSEVFKPYDETMLILPAKLDNANIYGAAML